MKLLIVACVIASSLAKRPLWYELDAYSFEDFEKDFSKRYENEAERFLRRTLFETRLAKIIRHNQGHASWKEGINHMSDWSDEEYEQLLGYNKALGHKMVQGGNKNALQYEFLNLPRNTSSVDWREQGVVSDVKDQGQCGSCWTFAATETLESQWAMATGVLSVLSEQNVLDCVPNPHNCGGFGGCQGGISELVYDTLKYKGLASEWTYPYISYFGDNFKCKFDPKTTPAEANITGYVKMPTNEYEPLMEAVSTKGPISITVEAIHWRDYETGVYDGCNQTNPDLDHVVQLVGFGTDDKLGDYWLVRNSWTPLWGEKGYVRLKRTSSEGSRCGTDIKPQDGSGCDGGPKTVKVCGTCGILYDTCYPLVQ